MEEEMFAWPEVRLPKPTEQFKLAFLSACIIGLVTHIYMFTNLLLNHDSTTTLFLKIDNLAYGRWFMGAASELGTRFQLPVVIGFLSIFMLALTAGLTVRILRLTNSVCIVITSGFLVTFPSVASMFSYLRGVETFFLALLMSAAAVYWAKFYPKAGSIVAILLMTLSCGIYQAFICYAIGLFLIDCILALYSDKPLKEIIGNGMRYIVICVVSLLVYYITLKILLRITGTNLHDYQGISSMGLEKNITTLLPAILKAYQDYFKYFLESPYLTKLFQTVQTLYFVLLAGLLGYLSVKRKTYQEPGRLILVLLGIGLLPGALNFITVLSSEAYVHALMIYSFVLQFVFCVKCTELAMQGIVQADRPGWILLGAVSTLLSGALIWNNFCVSNVGYLRLQILYENSYALANRIVARIEAVEGYSPQVPVAVIGDASLELYGGSAGVFSQYNGLTGMDDQLLYSPDPGYRIQYFLWYYNGLRILRPSGEKLQELNESEQIQAMPSYPAAGSVALYNDVVVVKLSDGWAH